jgi:hypothetical protein
VRRDTDVSRGLARGRGNDDAPYALGVAGLVEGKQRGKVIANLVRPYSVDGRTMRFADNP